MYKHFSNVVNGKGAFFRENLSVGHAIKFNCMNSNHNTRTCYCFAVDTLVNDFS